MEPAAPPGARRVRLAACCKALWALVDDNAGCMWAEVEAHLATPHQIALFHAWLAPRLPHVRALTLHIWGGVTGWEERGPNGSGCRKEDSRLRSPMQRLLGAVGASPALERLAVSTHSLGLPSASALRVSGKQLQLPRLQALELSGEGLALDLSDLRSLPALTQLRLSGGAREEELRHVALALPPALRTLVLPPAYGLPPELARATQLRALSLAEPHAGCGPTLKRLTFLTALALGQLPQAVDLACLAALTVLEALQLGQSPCASVTRSSLKPLAALTRLTTLVLRGVHALERLPGRVVALPALRVLCVESCHLGAIGGSGPEALALLEDLTLSLEAAEALGPQLAALPSLHTLRLLTSCGFTPDVCTSRRLAAVLAAAAAVPGLLTVHLGSGLWYPLQEHARAAQAAAELGQHGVAVRRLPHFESDELLLPSVV